MSSETLTASTGIQAQEAEEAEKSRCRRIYLTFSLPSASFPVSSTKCPMPIAGSEPSTLQP